MSKSIFQEGGLLDRPFRIPQVKQEPEVQPITEQAFFESVETKDALFESVSAMATSQARQDAAAAVVQWVEGGDADYDELDALLFGMVEGGDSDEEIELDDIQNEQYEQLTKFASEFMATFSGVDSADVALMDEDDSAADRVYEALENALSDVNNSEAIADFAVRESVMMEAKERVIRNGKPTYINKRKRKRRMSAAQKAALKKARRKAHTSAAKASRAKSMNLRK
ncbi:hypothetical protein H4F26_22625 [Vibrio alginolyticus]|uniref:hypothetical protein n=1 Tax=Vibrio TaxID=662 RepID=UPI00124E8630|nr:MULTISPECIES: hypothetical protein [Vibrio]EMD1213058.1 hypothetical protein [Vibrio alginolyticus]KAB2116652.1 hypothetical protein F6475_00420 [Vibrio alginolyticus]MBT0091740.1 hypothetical protein [Vibrio alginolyticus]MCR9559183.1 hypothetical protein [Vibrio alginolyticus]MCR9960336.1 hypothetical protein [Vibrio alginolyticus]